MSSLENFSCRVSFSYLFSSSLSPDFYVVSAEPAVPLCLAEATQVILVPPVKTLRIRPEDIGDITNAYRLPLDQFLLKKHRISVCI